MTNSKKLIWQLVISVIVLTVGCGLLIAGFIVPPLGVVDSSILIAFGEVCSFVGSVLGIDYTYRYKALKYNQENKNK